MALTVLKKPVKLLVVDYHHRHGSSIYAAWVPLGFDPDADWINENLLDGEFEPYREDEWLGVECYAVKNIPNFES
jgi:hypothetical protein